jgi:hypothetical protein
MGAELAVLLLLAAYNPSPLEVHAGLTSEARKGPCCLEQCTPQSTQPARVRCHGACCIVTDRITCEQHGGFWWNDPGGKCEVYTCFI